MKSCTLIVIFFRVTLISLILNTVLACDSNQCLDGEVCTDMNGTNFSGTNSLGKCVPLNDSSAASCG